MVLLDSNLFVIDRFFPRAVHYQSNRAFLWTLPTLEAGLSIFTLLELYGVASFNLTAKELKTWLYDFPTFYPVRILDPWDIGLTASRAWFGTFLEGLAENISRKMTFGDAILLREAERYVVNTIVT